MFVWLCAQEDLEGAVAGLTSRSLRELHGTLAGRQGIAALVDGLILNEAAGRFMKMRESNEGGKQS
jgi:hypothetical protein